MADFLEVYRCRMAEVADGDLSMFSEPSRLSQEVLVGLGADAAQQIATIAIGEQSAGVILGYARGEPMPRTHNVKLAIVAATADCVKHLVDTPEQVGAYFRQGGDILADDALATVIGEASVDDDRTRRQLAELVRDATEIAFCL